MRNKQKGQTVVIGSLLVLSVAVGALVFVQISVFPGINEDEELKSQGQAVQGMLELRSGLQDTLSSGSGQTVNYPTQVTYPPQPAAPPNQNGQVNFLTGSMSVENAEIKTGTNNSTSPLLIDQNNNNSQIDSVASVIQYQPSYIELLSKDRDIKMDNLIVYENNPEGNRIKHAGQSLISGRQINLIAPKPSVLGVKTKGQTAISIDPQYRITGEIRGSSGGSDNIKISVFSTETESDEWDKLEDNNDNVQDISGNEDNKLEIELKPTPQNADFYEFRLVRTTVAIE